MISNRLLFFIFNGLTIVSIILMVLLVLNDKWPSDETKSPIVLEDTETQISSDSERKIYYVDPQGNDKNDGKSEDKAFKTIQKAVDLAKPGDKVQLLPGVYLQDVVTRISGIPDNPITITGTREAIVKGGGEPRVFEINHDYITLDGFSIDGLHGDATKEKGYSDKLIYAVGKAKGKGVTEVKILNMLVKNAGGECIRFRYFAKRNEIAYNTIVGCGAFDFVLKGDGKNGEGIYIGTAPEQLDDGRNPSKERDESNNNWIHHNTIDTQGNECVDIKEGSYGNIVEYNNCTGQKDSESGGLDARGSKNILRYNEVRGNVGAGIRLGGDKEDDGINNDVYENIIQNNRSGGVKIQREPQGKICGNKTGGNSKGDSVGSYGEDFDPTKPC